MPSVLAAAAAVFLIWIAVSTAGVVPLPSSDPPFVFALKFAVAVVVVACPCGERLELSWLAARGCKRMQCGL